MEEKNKTEDVRDKFKDIIISWANGQEIQCRSIDNGEWFDIVGTPIWDSSYEYRVKPVITKKYIGVSVDEDGDIVYNSSQYNIELELEDNKIKSVKLLDEPIENKSGNVIIREVSGNKPSNVQSCVTDDDIIKLMKKMQKMWYF